MKTAAVLCTLLASASAFAPSAPSRAATTQLHESKADLEAMGKKLNPVVGYYDPLGLADANFWGVGNEATIGFLREAEVKHGRVAMFAFVGYIVHANGITWPWPMTLEGDAFPTGLSPEQAWDAIPDIAKLQIFWFVGFLEYWRESQSEKHYMSGGKVGYFPPFDSKYIPGGALNLYDPFGRNKSMSDEVKERRLIAEINNGRAAMLGIIGFVSASKMEGSVPLLKGVIPHYDGDVMAPMAKSILPFVVPEYSGPSL